MYKIYLDSSQRREKLVRLEKDGKIVAEKGGDIDLTVSMRALLNEHGIGLQDIETIDFNRGPGSFTGLKLGSTIANVIMWALGKRKPEGQILPEYGGEPNIQS
jgi:tRNA A37 threonylcarbamoyladenosine modification protein TsaB